MIATIWKKLIWWRDIGNNGNNGNGNGRGSSGSGGAQRIDSRRGPLSNKTDILHLLESSSTQSCLTAIHVSWTNQCTECINLLKVVNPYAVLNYDLDRRLKYRRISVTDI